MPAAQLQQLALEMANPIWHCLVLLLLLPVTDATAARSYATSVMAAVRVAVRVARLAGLQESCRFA